MLENKKAPARRLPIRAAGITVKNGKVLVLWRKNNGREYYVVPGGGVEIGETVEEATKRELREETSVTVRVEKLLYHLHYIKAGRGKSDHYFYLCRYISGKAKLGDFNEKKRMDGGKDLYKPLWLTLSAIEKIVLYPPEVKKWIVKDAKEDFKNDTRKKIVQLDSGGKD